ncbi:hypothetical protein P389DRAFT_114074 [Cystobasidium minutum MCA 4210]|uniref:uncharacterized protein n=1 Tax=Cystobasidium minutum MCA 4210 TaxID=1397322 RepID=UPI0034CF670C|eukprot:jgi/Rhomi1/114074/CE114073_1492
MSDVPPTASSSTSTNKRGASSDHPHRQEGSNGHDLPEEDNANKKRRMRYRVACLPCQRKKCRCDGGAPCGSCQQRKIQNCEYGPVKFKDGSVAQLEYADLKQRLMQVEARLNRLDQLFPPDGFNQHLKIEGHELSEGPTPSQRATSDNGNEDISEAAQAFDNAAETAAMLLEEKTLGREQYGPLGGSRTVIHGNFTKPPRETADSLSSPERHATAGLLATQITRAPLLHKLPTAGQQVTLGRQLVMTELINALPPPDLGDFLVHEYLHSTDWVYKVFHRSLFLDEVQQLWLCVRSGNTTDIDPAWLALFFMVLSWPANTDLVRRAVPALYNLSVKDLEAMAEKWKYCAEQALHLSDWAAVPQMRVLQALCLIMNYQDGKCAYPAAGNTAFYIWLSSAVRIAQIMKLDRAEEQNDAWLSDDPAFPPGQSGIKQEICRRVWCLLLISDWVFNSHAGRPSIPLGSFTTLDPMRVNDEDLGRELDYHERPAHELTDVDFFTVRLGLAKFQHAVNGFWSSSTKTYQMILDLDAHLEKSVKEIPATTQTSNTYNKPHHRSVALCVLHNRRLRLHRPFLIRGLRNPTSRYATSAQLCIASATTICSALDAIVEAQKLDVFWYIFSQVLAAVICIFVDHFHRVMTNSQPVKLALSNPSIASARRFYDAGLNSTVPSVVQAARRGCTVMDALSQYEDELRRDASGGTNIEERLTGVLQRAAELVEAAGLESAAASPIAAPVLLSDFLALDAYSTVSGAESDILASYTNTHLPPQLQEGSLPLQNSWLGEGGLVDWSKVFLTTGDPGLFGP